MSQVKSGLQKWAGTWRICCTFVQTGHLCSSPAFLPLTRYAFMNIPPVHQGKTQDYSLYWRYSDLQHKHTKAGSQVLERVCLLNCLLYPFRKRNKLCKEYNIPKTQKHSFHPVLQMCWQKHTQVNAHTQRKPPSQTSRALGWDSEILQGMLSVFEAWQLTQALIGLIKVR